MKGEPLGTLAIHAWSRLDRTKRPKPQGSLCDLERESLRWIESAERASERLFDCSSPIHIMDREGDQFELFATLAQTDERFVIRLGRREREGATKKQKAFPQREAREARLEIRAKKINLHRSHQYAEHLPEYLPLNFVEAREVDCAHDTIPVVWRLVTTEPIETDEQIGDVTGCQFESHQLQDIKGLLVALSIESAIAWQLLRLRYLGRNDPNAPAATLITNEQYQSIVLLRQSRGHPETALNVRDVVDELARLGVHIKNNGPPGWIVLKRGMEKLNLLAQGIRISSATTAILGDVIDL